MTEDQSVSAARGIARYEQRDDTSARGVIQMATTVERRYALTRLDSGDYLLPSNDGATIWRISKHKEEDGSLTDHDGNVIRGTFWQLHRMSPPSFERWRDKMQNPMYSYAESWDDWEFWAGLLTSRKEAIEAALQVGAPS